MKAIVTGGCGFLGSHICEAFIKNDWEVIAYDNMTKYELKRTGFCTDEVRNHNSSFLKDIGVKIVKADIRDNEELLDSSSGCDFIAHTAAQPAMTISWEDPYLDFTTNVLGTFNVLTSARKHKIPIASCSSVHVYGPWINDSLTEKETRFIRNPVTIKEDDKTMEGGMHGLISPLHASKASAEHYVRSFADMYGVKAATFRYTGIYGPRQFGGEDHGWVANFSIRNFLEWHLNVYGTGKQLRDILFATDAAQAFLAFQRSPVPGTYNIGGGENNMISLLECINVIDKISGRKSIVDFGPERKGDLSYFVCNIDKAKKILGWEPNVSPEEGIGELIRWIETHSNLFNSSDKSTN